MQHIFLTDRLATLRLKLSANSQILTVGDKLWEQALESFNKDSENQTPSIYVKCSSEQDVAECINFARQNNLALTPRSGSHNLGNFSLLQGGLIIDIKKMKNITHSTDCQTITYQTGCRFGQIDDYVNTKLPGFAYVGAMDPSIGTAGARCALGVGWLQRLLGNGVDNIVSARIVLADGSIVVASQKENPDLLFGIRGAGSNFGVVTQLTQKIHQVLDPKQGNQVLYAAHFYEIDKAHKVYDKILQISLRNDFPDEAFMLPVLHFVQGKRGLSIFFCHYRYNNQAKCIETDQHWTQKALKNICAQYKGLPINQLGNQDGWGSISHALLQNKAMNIPWGSSFYPCGGFVTDQNTKAVTDALIENWRVSNIPQFSKDVPFHSTAFYHFGGKTQRNRKPEMTAWPGNEKTSLLTVTWGGWKQNKDKNQMIRWVKEQWKPIIQNLQFGYLCAAAFDWNNQNFSRFIYGPNFEKLSLIKAKYDPTNIFRHNVNIPPRKA